MVENEDDLTLLTMTKKKKIKYALTLSVWQIKIDSCANCVDPDETACNEPRHQDLLC